MFDIKYWGSGLFVLNILGKEPTQQTEANRNPKSPKSPINYPNLTICLGSATKLNATTTFLNLWAPIICIWTFQFTYWICLKGRTLCTYSLYQQIYFLGTTVVTSIPRKKDKISGGLSSEGSTTDSILDVIKIKFSKPVFASMRPLSTASSEMRCSKPTLLTMRTIQCQMLLCCFETGPAPKVYHSKPERKESYHGVSWCGRFVCLAVLYTDTYTVI